MSFINVTQYYKFSNQNLSDLFQRFSYFLPVLYSLNWLRDFSLLKSVSIIWRIIIKIVRLFTPSWSDAPAPRSRSKHLHEPLQKHPQSAVLGRFECAQASLPWGMYAVWHSVHFSLNICSVWKEFVIFFLIVPLLLNCCLVFRCKINVRAKNKLRLNQF